MWGTCLLTLGLWKCTLRRAWNWAMERRFGALEGLPEIAWISFESDMHFQEQFHFFHQFLTKVCNHWPRELFKIWTKVWFSLRFLTLGPDLWDIKNLIFTKKQKIIGICVSSSTFLIFNIFHDLIGQNNELNIWKVHYIWRGGLFDMGCSQLQFKVSLNATTCFLIK